jgi:hypothetical protein
MGGAEINDKLMPDERRELQWERHDQEMTDAKRVVSGCEQGRI